MEKNTTASAGSTITVLLLLLLERPRRLSTQVVLGSRRFACRPPHPFPRDPPPSWRPSLVTSLPNELPDALPPACTPPNDLPLSAPPLIASSLFCVCVRGWALTTLACWTCRTAVGDAGQDCLLACAARILSLSIYQSIIMNQPEKIGSATSRAQERHRLCAASRGPTQYRGRRSLLTVSEI